MLFFYSDRLKMQLIQKDADIITLEADVKQGQAKVKVSYCQEVKK